MRELDAHFEGRLLGSAAYADPVTVVHIGRELRAQRVAVVALDGVEGLRDADSRRPGGARAARRRYGRLGAMSLPFALYRQMQAVVEGATWAPTP